MALTLLYASSASGPTLMSVPILIIFGSSGMECRGCPGLAHPHLPHCVPEARQQLEIV